MTAKLHVIGVGPGDPELLTLKAARIIRETPVLFVPKGREEGTSLALSIVSGAVPIDGKKIVELHFPMMKTRTTAGGDIPPQDLDAKWQDAARAVMEVLESGSDGAFITIGDPAVYSTFFYLYDKLLDRRPDLAVEFVPGISSVNAAAARARISLGLGNERIAILPANYLDSLPQTLEAFDSVVLMKVNKVFDQVRETLTRMGLAERAVLVSRAGMDDEQVWRDIGTVREADLPYFSLMIVRKP